MLVDTCVQSEKLTSQETSKYLYNNQDRKKEKHSLKTLCFKEDGLSWSQKCSLTHTTPWEGNSSAYGQASGCKRVMGLGMPAMSLKVGERELTPKDSFLTILCWTLDSELGPKEPRSRCQEQDVLVCG